jgi:hypothetical protein
VPGRRAGHHVLIREPLEGLYRTFDDLGSATDPVHVVRRYHAPADREIAGFCAAALAFGRVSARSIPPLTSKLFRRWFTAGFAGAI